PLPPHLPSFPTRRSSDLAHKTEMSCVNLIPTPHRSYHAPTSLGHVLGYMSEVTPEEMDDHPEYRRGQTIGRRGLERRWEKDLRGDRKSTRLNSSHRTISY